jgi:uncharacterized protein (DUF433 family)
MPPASGPTSRRLAAGGRSALVPSQWDERLGRLTSSEHSRRCGGTPRGYAAAVAYTRITVDPAVMGGMPCIRGLRVPVATVVAMVADGMTADEIVRDLPYLEREDVEVALRFAADAVRERELPLTRPA